MSLIFRFFVSRHPRIRRMCELPDVKVVSVSYSGVEDQTRRDAATYCKSQGALMVNAAGNDSRDLTQFGEADNDDLIVVGASTSSDNKSGFSAHGRFVDVWAPGSSVWTTTTGSTYAPVSGTSFSCPLVAGLIALIWSANPQLSPNEVEAILKTSTDNVGIQDTWNTQYGRVNSYNAVIAAGSNTFSVSHFFDAAFSCMFVRAVWLHRNISQQEMQSFSPPSFLSAHHESNNPSSNYAGNSSLFRRDQSQVHRRWRVLHLWRTPQQPRHPGIRPIRAKRAQHHRRVQRRQLRKLP